MLPSPLAIELHRVPGRILSEGPSQRDTSNTMVSVAETSPRASAWLAKAPIDLAMAFGWLPFYAWLLTTPVAGDIADAAFLPALKLAAVVALSVNFVGAARRCGCGCNRGSVCASATPRASSTFVLLERAPVSP
jgi:hypothetical protein